MTRKVLLRPATIEDSGLLLEWRNEPEVIEHSLSQVAVPPDEHQVWFRESMASPDCRIWIALYQEEPVGQVRLTTKPSPEVHISVAAEHRGAGFGTAMLHAFKDLYPGISQQPVAARVLESNTRSMRTFLRAGWSVVSTQEGATTLSWTPGNIPHV